MMFSSNVFTPTIITQSMQKKKKNYFGTIIWFSHHFFMFFFIEKFDFHLHSKKRKFIHFHLFCLCVCLCVCLCEKKNVMNSKLLPIFFTFSRFLMMKMDDVDGEKKETNKQQFTIE